MRDIYGCLTPRWNPKGENSGRRTPPTTTRRHQARHRAPRRGLSQCNQHNSFNNQSNSYAQDWFQMMVIVAPRGKNKHARPSFEHRGKHKVSINEPSGCVEVQLQHEYQNKQRATRANKGASPAAPRKGSRCLPDRLRQSTPTSSKGCTKANRNSVVYSFTVHRHSLWGCLCYLCLP